MTLLPDRSNKYRNTTWVSSHWVSMLSIRSYIPAYPGSAAASFSNSSSFLNMGASVSETILPSFVMTKPNISMESELEISLNTLSRKPALLYMSALDTAAA